jgi:hypothetical protein
VPEFEMPKSKIALGLYGPPAMPVIVSLPSSVFNVPTFSKP